VKGNGVEKPAFSLVGNHQDFSGYDSVLASFAQAAVDPVSLHSQDAAQTAPTTAQSPGGRLPEKSLFSD
jgi:hypothetical protein